MIKKKNTNMFKKSLIIVAMLSVSLNILADTPEVNNCNETTVYKENVSKLEIYNADIENSSDIIEKNVNIEKEDDNSIYTISINTQYDPIICQEIVK